MPCTFGVLHGLKATLWMEDFSPQWRAKSDLHWRDSVLERWSYPADQPCPRQRPPRPSSLWQRFTSSTSWLGTRECTTKFLDVAGEPLTGMPETWRWSVDIGAAHAGLCCVWCDRDLQNFWCLEVEERNRGFVNNADFLAQCLLLGVALLGTIWGMIFLSEFRSDMLWIWCEKQHLGG